MLHLSKPQSRAVLIHCSDPEKLVEDLVQAIQNRAVELGL
jgi:hypothetical protein